MTQTPQNGNVWTLDAPVLQAGAAPIAPASAASAPHEAATVSYLLQEPALQQGTAQEEAPKTMPSQEVAPQQSAVPQVSAPLWGEDALLHALLYINKHYNKRFAQETLLAGLPLKNGALTPALFVRAAQRAGLKAAIVERSLSDISAHTLPAVLLGANGQTAILTAKDEDGALTVASPVNDDDVQVLRTPAEQAAHPVVGSYTGQVILVRPAFAFEKDPTHMVSSSDWFWGTIGLFGKLYTKAGAAAFFVNLFGLLIPLFIMNVYDRVVPNGATATLWVLTIGVTLAFMFDFAFRMLRSYFIDLAGRGADVLMASRIYAQVLNIRLGKKGTASAGAFANQLREFETIRDFFTSATVTALVDLPFMLLFIFFIALIGGPVALVPLLTIPVVLLVCAAAERPMGAIIKQASKDLDAKHGHLVESINALETIKALNTHSSNQGRWEQLVGATARLGLRTRFLSSLGMSAAAFLQQMSTVLVVVVGVYRIMDGSMSVGALVACTLLASRGLAPLTQAVGLYSRYEQSKVALEALNTIMRAEVERPEGKTYVQPSQIKGNMVLNDVSFTYPESELESLKRITLNIRAGERVGVIGRTGSGKSTVLRLMLNLYEPTQGQMLLDGLDMRQLDPAVFRNAMAYVPQRPILFTGTVRENILAGVEGLGSKGHVSDDDLIQAAERAGVLSFVQRHPLGLDMPVGERGDALSGGQRQSVALARAFVRKSASIALLDEPTSELDQVAEKHVLESMKEALQGKTVVLVTHKHGMLDLVDRLVVIEEGRIILDGAKDAVLQRLNGSAPTTETQVA